MPIAVNVKGVDISVSFKWYDVWVGVYIDNAPFFYQVYICLIPCFPIQIRWDRKQWIVVGTWPESCEETVFGEDTMAT